ncbi:MAG TPA: hypothetical protein VKA26_11080 [Ignavibacteriaceae bacterium]|nr:hypothetical protein [Ignavibacteriaceae bacterium]
MIANKIIIIFIFVGILLILFGAINFDHYSMLGIVPISIGIGILELAAVSKEMD